MTFRIARFTGVLVLAFLVASLVGAGAACAATKTAPTIRCTDGSYLGETIYYTIGSSGVDTITRVTVSQTGGAKTYRRLRCKIGDGTGYYFDSYLAAFYTNAMTANWYPNKKVSHGTGFVVGLSYTGTSSGSVTKFIGSTQANTR